MKIAINSTNPIKFNATRLVFQQTFPKESHEFICFNIVNHVSQKNDLLTLLDKAINHANTAIKNTSADYGIAIESGIFSTQHGSFSQSWCAIVNKNNILGMASGSAISIPETLMQKIRDEKIDLNTALDKILGQEKSFEKISLSAYLTQNKIGQTENYFTMLIYALSSLNNKITLQKTYSRKKIYFSGSEMAFTENSDNYNTILKNLTQSGNTVFSSFEYQNGKINITDSPFVNTMEWIKQSDIMIAEVSKPGLNTGFEIAYAVSKKIPVIALYQKGSAGEFKSMIAGKNSQFIKIYEYTTTQLDKLMKKLFEDTV